ncbi:hypothetical protein HDV64DRAFT_147148 [Trichoderma sp. TUCIM 5745]
MSSHFICEMRSAGLLIAAASSWCLFIFKPLFGCRSPCHRLAVLRSQRRAERDDYLQFYMIREMSWASEFWELGGVLAAFRILSFPDLLGDVVKRYL